MLKIFIILNVLFCLAACTPSVDVRFDDILMSSHYRAREGFLENESPSVRLPTTKDSLGTLRIYLFPKESAWEMLKTFNRSAKYNQQYEAYVKKLSLADLKKQFHIYIFLIRKDTRKAEDQSASGDFRNGSYREERHTFDDQANQWVLSDEVNVAGFSEIYKVIKWKEAFLGAELKRVKQMINAYKTKQAEDRNAITEGRALPEDDASPKGYVLPEGFFVLDSATIDLKRRQYKMLVLEKNTEKDNKAGWHFDLPLVLLEKKKGQYFQIGQNDNLIFKNNHQCPADGYGQLSVKGPLFSIVQIGCVDFSFVQSNVTFRIDEQTGSVTLDSYAEAYTDRSDPDREIPDRIWTEKDFGDVTFAELSADQLINLK